MKEIPTASDISKKYESILQFDDEEQNIINNTMIEFAKLHVEAALEKASENADTRHIRNTNDYEIDRDSILNAYPLDNIK